MEPQNIIDKRKKANINLAPGNSGAEKKLPIYKTYMPSGDADIDIPVLISRWKLSFRERIRVLFGGSIWLGVIGERHPAVILSSESLFKGEDGKL